MADVAATPFINYGGQVADTANTMANTNVQNQQAGLLQQQQQAAAMQNQITKARMPIIMSAISSFNDDTSDESGAVGQGGQKSRGTDQVNGPAGQSNSKSDDSGAWYDPGAIDAGLRNRYFVTPYTPMEMKRIQASAASGDQGLIQLAKAQRDQRLETQTAASQLDAGDLFDTMRNVTNADPGAAMTALERVAPDTVAKIRKQYPDIQDEDAAARAFAAHTAGVVHQYTGRGAVENKADGTYRDEKSGLIIPGVEKAGLTQEQWMSVAREGMKYVDVPNGMGGTTQIPAYQRDHAPDLSSWIMTQASNAGVWGAHPTIGGAPKAIVRKGVNAAAAAAQKEAETQNPETATNVGPYATTANGKQDAQLTTALRDTDFRGSPPKAKFGTTLSPDQQDLRKDYVAKAQALKGDSDAGIPAAQNALSFYQAAQDILDNKGASTGKWTSIIAKAGQYLPGINLNNVSNYQELSKYLGNAALNAGKGLFPKMTQKEGDWVLNKLNPSPDMTETAVRQMIANGRAIAQYSLDSSQRIGAYLRANNDPTRFNTWNSKYYPLPDAVEKATDLAAAKDSKGPGGAPQWSEAQIAAYAKKHNISVATAKNFLGSK